MSSNLLPATREGPPSAADGQPSPKKLKIAASLVMESNSIVDALLLEAKMQGKDAPMLQLQAQHKVFIVNKAAAEASLPDGAYVCGMGKGSFKLFKQDQALEGNLYEFKLTDQNDLVVMNGAVVGLGKVVLEQREKNPAVKVNYHNIVIDDGNPKEFKLTQTHRICFQPKDENGEASQNNLAMKEEPKTWNASCLHVLWVVRWTAKGLMPVKPQVHLKGSLILPAGRSCHANGMTE